MEKSSNRNNDDTKSRASKAPSITESAREEAAERAYMEAE